MSLSYLWTKKRMNGKKKTFRPNFGHFQVNSRNVTMNIYMRVRSIKVFFYQMIMNAVELERNGCCCCFFTFIKEMLCCD